MKTMLPADQALPGDIVHGTWSDTYPQPRMIETMAYAPDHSTTGPAYTLNFTDGGTKTYYGTCQLTIDRPT